uniref:HLH domain-containing protein n=2 Tax=Charistephane fugiens TaxID=140462 RepID=V9PP03_9METZ|nr:HLH domain-containing protein [Charistephane fugiens]
MRCFISCCKMGMENFVAPFLGLPFPTTDTTNSEISSHNQSSRSRKLSRKRRKLSGMKRIAATTRERSRIEHLNCAFITLRSRIPTQPSDVKLTKVETLRLAMSYIMHLEKLVADIESQDTESTGSAEVSSSNDVREEAPIVRLYNPNMPNQNEMITQGSWQQYGLPVRPRATMDPPYVIKKKS